MPYNNRYYDDRRGGYNRGGYNDRRGYNDRYNDNGRYDDRGGYNSPRDRFQNNGFRYEIGQKVRHIATGLELSVISFGREQIECRLPDLSASYFYESELEPIEGPEDKK